MRSGDSPDIGPCSDKVSFEDIRLVKPKQVRPRWPIAGQRSRPGDIRGPPRCSGVLQRRGPQIRPQPANRYEVNFEKTPPVANVAKSGCWATFWGQATPFAPEGCRAPSAGLSGRAVLPQSDILLVLEDAMGSAGGGFVQTHCRGYRLTPDLATRFGSGRTDVAEPAPNPAYGVSVVPLHHVVGGVQTCSRC